MKKNRTFRVAAMLLVLTLITCCALSGTLAKYISDVSAISAAATVAKWDSEAAGEVTMTGRAIAPDTETSDDKWTPTYTVTVAGVVDTLVTYDVQITKVELIYDEAWVADGADYYPLVLTSEGKSASTPAANTDGKMALTIEYDNPIVLDGATISEVTAKVNWPFYVDAEGDEKDTELAGLGTLPTYQVKFYGAAVQTD